jgi:hypothetical protein
LRITTRTKVPRFPALRTSTTIAAAPKRSKKRKYARPGGPVC